MVPSNTSSIAASETSSDKRIGEGAKPLIYVERIGGFRGTPHYSFSVYSNGAVVYNGIRNVGTKGIVQFDVSITEVHKLARYMVDMGFLTFEDKYPYLPDGTKNITALRGLLGGLRVDKTVEDYGVVVPHELLKIRETLEERLGIKRLLERRTSAQEFSSVLE